MIVNNKFRPVELTETSPIKKTHDFYKTTGNLWDSRYLSSPKVSRYYHDIQESFLSSPKSPSNLSYQESLEKSKLYAQKAQKNRKASQELLRKRKNERIQLTLFNVSENSQRKKPEVLLTPTNMWERLNTVPVCKLRHVMPETVVAKDKCGIDNIFEKSAEIEKMNKWFEAQKQGKRLKVRLAIINRHNEQRELEKKCGVIKVRDKSAPVGTFGYVQRHKVRMRTEELSKPHTPIQGSRFDHRDFRGLLHADFPEAVQKLNSLNNTQMITNS